MKKKFLIAIISTTFILLFTLTLNTQSVYANVNDEEFLDLVIDTKCTIDGVIVGYSNDCGPGEGSCIDRDC